MGPGTGQVIKARGGGTGLIGRQLHPSEGPQPERPSSPTSTATGHGLALLTRVLSIGPRSSLSSVSPSCLQLLFGPAHAPTAFNHHFLPTITNVSVLLFWITLELTRRVLKVVALSRQYIIPVSLHYSCPFLLHGVRPILILVLALFLIP